MRQVEDVPRARASCARTRAQCGRCSSASSALALRARQARVRAENSGGIVGASGSESTSSRVVVAATSGARHARARAPRHVERAGVPAAVRGERALEPANSAR